MANWWTLNKKKTFNFHHLVRKIKYSLIQKEIQFGFLYTKGPNYYDVNFLKPTGYVMHQPV